MKKKAIISAVLALTLVLGLGVAVLAYDSSEDPIISLSYLTDIFKPLVLRELETKIDTKIAEAVKNIPASQPTEPSVPSPSQPDDGEEAQTGYTVIELNKDDELYASDACDIMLRSGKASCIAPDPKQGIADYTDATEILNGQPLVKNHMCLIPRGDGRGVIAESESVFIMVRGEYIVVRH